MAQLGHLEATVMDCLWSHEKPMSVREVLELLNRDRDLAYTTVMTVLDNLYRKGMVRREKSGRAWVYLAAASRSSYTAELMEQALADSPDRRMALLRFVEQLSAEEIAQLRRVLDSPDPQEGSASAKGAPSDGAEQR